MAVIGALVVIFLGWKIYKLFTRKPSGNSRCVGCNMDCALKDLNPEHCEKDEDILKNEVKK